MNFEGLELNFEGLDVILWCQDLKLEGLDLKFEGLDLHFEGLELKLEGLDGIFECLDLKFEGLDFPFSADVGKRDQTDVAASAADSIDNAGSALGSSSCSMSNVKLRFKSRWTGGTGVGFTGPLTPFPWGPSWGEVTTDSNGRFTKTSYFFP